MKSIAVSSAQTIAETDWTVIIEDEKDVTTMEFECDAGSYEVSINGMAAFRVKAGNPPKLRRVGNNGIDSVSIRALEASTTGLWSYAVID